MSVSRAHKISCDVALTQIKKASKGMRSKTSEEDFHCGGTRAWNLAALFSNFCVIQKEKEERIKRIAISFKKIRLEESSCTTPFH